MRSVITMQPEKEKEKSSSSIKDECHMDIGHELTLHGEGGKAIPEEYQSESCRACGLRIFITPTYICESEEVTCKFCIHKSCADLPSKINVQDKILQQLQINSEMTLLIKTPEAYESICVVCRRKPDNKSYIYVDIGPAESKQFIHLTCAFDLIRIRHKSHRHDLIALRGESYTFRCGGCGKEHAVKAPAKGNDVTVEKQSNATADGNADQNMQSNATADGNATVPVKIENATADGNAGVPDQNMQSNATADGNATVPDQNMQSNATADGKAAVPDQNTGKRQYPDKPSGKSTSSGDGVDPQYFYVCVICPYWLHHDCASLPEAIRHPGGHPAHALSLITFDVSQGAAPVCELQPCCENEKNQKIESSLAYFCSRCEIYAHVSCATKDTDKYRPASIRETQDDEDVNQLPLPNDEHKYSILHLKVKTLNFEKTLNKPELHEHKLILHENVDRDLTIVDDDDESTSEVVCDACVEPIRIKSGSEDKLILDPAYHSHYRCAGECSNFFLHMSCAELLKPELEHHRAHKVDDHNLQLFKRPPSSSNKLLSLFNCECCGRRCNGFAYGCRRCDFYVDVVCAFLPKLITHNVAHDKFHVLSLRHSASARFINTNSKLWFYDCRSCPFTLHAKCALLPRVAHVGSEFDEHALKLVASEADYELYSSDDHYCEICEEEIDVRARHTRNKWYYRCEKSCDRLFHVECIPSVSPALSKVKFGQAIRVNCHECDVVSVRMLTVGSHQCGFCSKIIEGRKDDQIAFKCSKCNFWIHYDCAEQCQ